MSAAPRRFSDTLNERPLWKFGGRFVDDDGREKYLWMASTWYMTDVYAIPVDEFWPAPKPAATVRPGSILDRIATVLGWKPNRPGAQADYALATGKATP